MSNKWENDEILNRFREYLKIPSVHPDVDYSGCIEFLIRQAKGLGLPFQVLEFAPNKPILVITWEGLQPNLPSIMLNSHMDVVPVYEEYWTHPPFSAHISEDGFIYARGTQDMKGIGMMHLEAVRRLKDDGIRLKRTVHITFVPDEEINGEDGMAKFAVSNEFLALNVGLELDESMPSSEDRTIVVFNGERTCRQIKIIANGEPGHGSLLSPGTAGEKLHYVVDKLMKFREAEMKKLKSLLYLGDVTTVNLTMLEGGVQVNVLPECLTASFDIRIAPDRSHDGFENMIKDWCKEAGEGVSFEYITWNPEIKNTKIDGSVPFWPVLKEAVENMGLKLICVICAGATDAKYIRQQGIPAINFSPIINTPFLLHAHDERIHVDAYRKGIDVMEKVLQAVANV